jgi:putative ATPase
MILAGEDPRFILRRLIVLAGEDIGLADRKVSRWRLQRHTLLNTSVCQKESTPLLRLPFILPQLPIQFSRAFFTVREEIEQNGAGSVPIH